MKRAIITPTFKGHFKYIKRYLESFKKYVTDPNEVTIIFTISKDEEKLFKNIIKPYKELPIQVLYFEELLAHFGISQTPQLLMDKYKKFSYQTMKKFYTMLYSKADYFLVLDSESMFIRETNISKLFDDFKQSPFISYSNLNERAYLSNFTENVINNIDYILNTNCDKWFLENFVWFYDKNILKDMVNDLGQPIEFVDKIYQNRNAQGIESGVFEIELYQAYIYMNNFKYNYNLINVNEKLRIALGNDRYNNYVKSYTDKYKGDFGLVEMAMLLLTTDNIEPLANMFKDNKFNIIRCDNSEAKNYLLQTKFLNIVQPNILAASQDHAFGINNKFICLLSNDKYINKFKKHFSNAIKPFKIFGYWLSEFLSIFWYGISSILEISKIVSILSKEKK